MKRVVLTGSTGFVGANLARRLIRDGHSLTAFVRPGSDQWRLDEIRPHARVVPVALEDMDAIRQALSHARPDWIFHLAVHGAYSWQTDWQKMVATNVVGTMNLVEAALAGGFESFVNTGSSSEYGLKDHAAREDEWLEPNSYYAVSKAAATEYCHFVGRREKVNLSTLRLYSVFGPWEEPNRLMPTVIVRGLRGQLPPLVSPQTARDYVYVDDAVEAFIKAASASRPLAGEVFNVGTGCQTTVAQVVETARRLLSVEQEPVWGSMPDRDWDTSVWVADVSKIKNWLDWSPASTFESGFSALARWLAESEDRQGFYRQRIAGAVLPGKV